MLQARHMTETATSMLLFDLMSPGLRRSVNFAANRFWIEKVPYFNDMPLDCMAAISVSLTPAVYSPQELITAHSLHIIMRGLAARHSRILTRGDVWGEDMILQRRDLMNTTRVRAVTYLDVFSLELEALQAIIDEFPAMREVRVMYTAHTSRPHCPIRTPSHTPQRMKWRAVQLALLRQAQRWNGMR